jgi:ABC-type transport system involved in cytochrome bd biosynthesis fused ATPase/permease subunit
LAGASGKGKSTFLKAIAGLYPSEGISLSTKSKRIKPRNPETDKTLYLAQDPTILSRTIEENLVWGRKMTGEEKTIIETSGILAPIFQQRSWTSRLAENGADLSGGEKQRIALARILLSDAEIILLDEATSSLDDEAAEKIMKCLKKHAEKRMIIYTSHKKEEQRFCDRTIAL